MAERNFGKSYIGHRALGSAKSQVRKKSRRSAGAQSRVDAILAGEGENAKVANARKAHTQRVQQLNSTLATANVRDDFELLQLNNELLQSDTDDDSEESNKESTELQFFDSQSKRSYKSRLKQLIAEVSVHCAQTWHVRLICYLARRDRGKAL